MLQSAGVLNSLSVGNLQASNLYGATLSLSTTTTTNFRIPGVTGTGRNAVNVVMFARDAGGADALANAYVIVPEAPLSEFTLVHNAVAGGGTVCYLSFTNSSISSPVPRVGISDRTDRIFVGRREEQPAIGYRGSDADPGYRLSYAANALVTMTTGVNWTLSSTCVVPPVPAAITGTYYIWIDTDFDNYGPSYDPTPLSRMKFNQIVPQLMIGNCLSGNDANYNPTWTDYTAWVIQAQYYWCNYDTNASFAYCGDVQSASPGDVITTTISYVSTGNGTITATITNTTTGQLSTIAATSPFMGPTLTWNSFMSQAAAQGGGLQYYMNPVFCIETHYEDVAGVEEVIPFVSYGPPMVVTPSAGQPSYAPSSSTPGIADNAWLTIT